MSAPPPSYGSVLQPKIHHSLHSSSDCNEKLQTLRDGNATNSSGATRIDIRDAPQCHPAEIPLIWKNDDEEKKTVDRSGSKKGET